MRSYPSNSERTRPLYVRIQDSGYRTKDYGAGRNLGASPQADFACGYDGPGWNVGKMEYWNDGFEGILPNQIYKK
jgi:hypothetical protein